MRKLELLSIFLVFSTFVVSAQDRQPLSLEQAFEMTFSGNDRIKANESNYQVAVKEKKAAAGLRSPKFDLIGNYSYMSNDIGIDLNSLKPSVGGIIGSLPPSIIPPSIGQQLMNADWSYIIQKDNFGFVGVSGEMPIYTGGKINIANRVANIKVEESLEQTNQTKGALFSELIERYYGLALALQVVSTREQVVKGMEHHVSDAVSLERNGMIPKVERLYAEMHLADAKKEYNIALTNVETIEAALRNTINKEQGQIIPLSALFIIKQINSIDHYKQLAMGGNSMLKQVGLKEKLAHEGVKMQRSEFAPQLVAMGAANIYRHQVTSLVPTWAVGAGLKFNIFNGLNREFKFSAAKSKVRYVESMSDQAHKDIATLIEKLYGQLNANRDIVESLDSALAFNEEYLRIKEKAFAEGSAISTDVVDARLMLARSKIERLQAAYKFDVTLAQLYEACGISTDFLMVKNDISYQPICFK